MRKIIVVVSIVVFCIAVCLAPRVAQRLFLSSFEFKSAHSGTATVACVRRSVSGSIPSEVPIKYTVCFSITDWGRLSNRLKLRYESVESRREKTDGPRCEVFKDAPVFSKIKPDDRIAITYMLYNDSTISIEKIRVLGVALEPVTPLRGTEPCVRN